MLVSRSMGDILGHPIGFVGIYVYPWSSALAADWNTSYWSVCINDGQGRTTGCFSKRSLAIGQPVSWWYSYCKNSLNLFTWMCALRPLYRAECPLVGSIVVWGWLQTVWQSSYQLHELVDSESILILLDRSPYSSVDDSDTEHPSRSSKRQLSFQRHLPYTWVPPPEHECENGSSQFQPFDAFLSASSSSWFRCSFAMLCSPRWTDLIALSGGVFETVDLVSFCHPLSNYFSLSLSVLTSGYELPRENQNCIRLVYHNNQCHELVVNIKIGQ